MSTSLLPDHIHAMRDGGYLSLSCRFSPTHSLSLILGRDDLRLLVDLLAAPNATEIAGWLREQAAAMEQAP